MGDAVAWCGSKNVAAVVGHLRGFGIRSDRLQRVCHRPKQQPDGDRIAAVVRCIDPRSEAFRAKSASPNLGHLESSQDWQPPPTVVG